MSKTIFTRMKPVILAVLLTVILPAAGFASADDGVAVRVNDREFSVETVQRYINETAANMPLTIGQTAQELFAGAHEEFLKAAAEHFVTVAIVEDKLKEKGLDKLSDEESESMQDYARQAYEQIWQSVSEQLKEEYPEEPQTDRLVTETMENAGYSMDGIYEKAVQNLMLERFAAAYCPEVTVTEEELREFYRTSYIEPDRELYENNIPLFEEKVLYSGESSTYIPEGYYYVKFIALKTSDERAGAITRAEEALAAARAESQLAQAALTEAALADQDLTEVRARYQAAQEAERQAEAALAESERQAETDYAPMADLVRTALANGETFESLIGKHSIQQLYTGRDEAGFPFHPASENWEEGVRERIAALTKAGECTDPVYTNGTVCIYCRMDDLVCGEYEPDEAAWEELRSSLLEAKQSEATNEKVAEWRGDYQVMIDLSVLTFPGE